MRALTMASRKRVLSSSMSALGFGADMEDRRSGLGGFGHVVLRHGIRGTEVGEVGLEAKATVALLAGDFLDEVQLFKVVENLVGLGEGDGEMVLDVVGGYGGGLEEVVDQGKGSGHVAEALGDEVTGALPQVDDFACGLYRVFG